jgi:TPR repeat protein
MRREIVSPSFNESQCATPKTFQNLIITVNPRSSLYASRMGGTQSKGHGVSTNPDVEDAFQRGQQEFLEHNEALDKLAEQLPNVIDDESRQQVEDYKQACDNGKGPMAACFATGEFLSLFERKHREAAELYRNVCFRPKTDKSPNRALIDGTMSYPAGCYNLAKMLMTGKGVVKPDRLEAYQLFDRACRGGHGGACYLQAQILCTPQGELGMNIPHDPKKAMELYQSNCDEGDSIR